ncbi:MAG: vWA domain-containing protein [Planctomycetaceae bacterium]
MNILNFVNLYGAWFSLAAIPLVILYFLKLRRPRFDVPSLVLWQSVLNDQRVNSPFQKFRRNLLLLLQLLLLALVILALMQPFIPADAGTSEYLPLLIDNSASMGALDEESGKSRLQLVLERVREQIENLRGGQQIALFTFASTGRRLTEFTNDRRQLLKALEQIQPTDLPARLDDVLRMTAAYTTSFPIDRVNVLTDGNLEEKVDFELPFNLNINRIGTPAPNLGITELSARRSGADEWEVFVRITGSAEQLLEAELQLFENGQQSQTSKVEVSKDDAERLVFPVNGQQTILLEARLVPAGFDALAADNSVWLSLPAVRPLKVLSSQSLNSWRRAASAVPNVESGAISGETGDVPEGNWDLLISDKPEDAKLPVPIKVLVGVIPEELKSLISVREELGSVVDWNRTAPLLRHVQLAEVEFAELPAYAEGASAKDLEERGYEVLIDGKAGPLLLQKREGLQTTWWFTFHTDRSTLPFRVGFPILAANAVDAAMKQSSLSEVNAAPTGVLPALNLDPEHDYDVRNPDGSRLTLRSNAAGLLVGASASRVGLYEILDGSETVAAVGTGLLNPHETSLADVEELKFTEAAVATQPAEQLATDQPLWWTLALAGLGMLLFEWWYFQRSRSGS